jgi:hypothetical protein
LHFSGGKVGFGNIPISIIGETLVRTQRVITNIGQSIYSGPNTKGRIPLEITDATELRLSKEMEAASFVIKISGRTVPALGGESLLGRSIECLFDLLEAGIDSENLLSIAGKIGNRALSSYRDWIIQLSNSDVTISTDWTDLEGYVREWKAYPEQLNDIYFVLGQINNNEPRTVKIEGFLLGASLIRDRFEFVQASTGDKITGNVAFEARVGVQEYFGRHCLGEFQIDSVVNSVTGATKEIWTLLQINSVPSTSSDNK